MGTPLGDTKSATGHRRQMTAKPAAFSRTGLWSRAFRGQRLMSFSIAVDMNLSPDWVAPLTAAGHRAVHWSAVGGPHALDTELAQWARDNGHLLLTHDLDFGTILAHTSASKPSVVIVRNQDPSPAAVGTYVLTALQQYAAELLGGALVIVDVQRSRVRILPIC